MRTIGARACRLPGSLRAPGRRLRAAAAGLALAIGFMASGGLAAQPQKSAPGKIHLVARDQPVRDVFLRWANRRT